MNKCLLYFSSIEDRHLRAAKQVFSEVQSQIKILRVSSVYKIAGRLKKWNQLTALFDEDESEFLAFGALLESQWTPAEVKKSIEDIVAKEAKSSRFLNVKLLASDAETQLNPDLTLPDPEFHNSEEELTVASEIWPEFIHPVLNENLKSLLKTCRRERVVEFFAQGKSLLDF